MVTIYGIKNCDTMKKAFAWLDAAGIAYQFHDYKKSGLTLAQLQHWAKQLDAAQPTTPADTPVQGWQALANTRGPTWRKVEGPGPLSGEVLVDEGGHWLVARGRLLHLEANGDRFTEELTSLPVEVRALAEREGALFLLARDGVYRTTQSDQPSFTPGPNDALPVRPQLAQAADLDGDGNLDLLGLLPVAGDSSWLGEPVLLLGDGRGHFRPGALPPLGRVRLWPGQLDLGDVDGDGTLDGIGIGGIRHRTECTQHLPGDAEGALVGVETKGLHSLFYPDRAWLTVAIPVS